MVSLPWEKKCLKMRSLLKTSKVMSKSSPVFGDVNNEVHHLLDRDDLVPVGVCQPHHLPGHAPGAQFNQKSLSLKKSLNFDLRFTIRS